jgi:NADP-dependent 3-hydroxy acid dehydrogenase YdfG
MSIDGHHVLVVGASSGIGRAFAVAAARAGARVALAARRLDRLQEALDEVPGGLALRCDVTDDESCRAAVREATTAAGALDLVLYAAGGAPLQPLHTTDAERWHDAFETNVVGLQRVVRASIPHLRMGSIVAALSSESVLKPRQWLGLYGATKAALDHSLSVWQLEHPELRFSCVTVGATQPTEFGASFDRGQLGPALEAWQRHGLMQERYMDTDELAAVLVAVMGAALANPSVNVERILVRSPSPVAALGDR